MNQALQVTSWLNMNNMNVQDKWNFIFQIYNTNTTSFIPEGLSFGGGIPDQKWMTRDAGQARKKKMEKWVVHRKKRTQESFATYVRARNDSVRAIRLAKQNFEVKIAEDIRRGDSRVFYSYLRSKTSIKEEVSKVTKANGTLSINTKETVDTMNRTFQSVFVREGNEPVPQINFLFDGIPLCNFEFDVPEVHKILSNLKESSAPGPDDIHPKVLKECADNLALPLYLLFRDSLDTSIIPDLWKTAYVTPIYKKGIKSDPLNYRPISLTSVPCKIFEKILRNRIIEHLEAHNILSIHQHGFRSNRSCLTQLLEYFLEVHDILDEHDPVDAIYLDCKKAFDTVPHRRLLAKLQAYGITGKVLKWIECFLSDRSQRVIVKG
ncbi:unnamed protein product, partial [Meganyctiphanes norvegica]